MYTLEKVTTDQPKCSFCMTDCGPSETCRPDDYFDSDD